MNFNVSSTGSSFLLTITEHGLGDQETGTSFLASGLRKTAAVDSSRGWFFFNIQYLYLTNASNAFLFFPNFQHYFQYFQYISFHQGKYSSDEKLLWPI